MNPGMIAFAACALAAAVYSLLQTGYLHLNYPSPERFPVRGIDVSQHQGEIDWPLVKAQGFHFAFIKATEGGDHVDTRFSNNWKGARAAGIFTVAYHFYRFCKPGFEQAKNFIRTVPADPKALPIVLDLEFGGNCNHEVPVAELVREVGDFVQTVEKVHSQTPIFYATPEFYERYLKYHAHLFPKHTLWIRNVYYEPRQEDCEEWGFWQFANRGRLDGISGPVDLNVYCGSIGRFSVIFGVKI